MATPPAVLWAQSESPRSPPQEVATEKAEQESTEDDGLSAPEQESRWRARLGFQESWESNPRLVESQDADSLVHRLESGLTRTQGGRRGELAVLAGASLLRYQKVPELDRLDYGAGVNASRRFTPWLTLYLAETFTSSHASNAGLIPGSSLRPDPNVTLSPQATLSGELVLPVTRTLANRAQIEGTARIGSRVTASALAQHTMTWFEAPELVDGSALDLTVALNRRLTPLDTVGGFYAFQLSRAAGLEQPIHVAAMVARRRFNPRWEAGSALGVTILPAVAAEPAFRLLYASAELSGELRRARLAGQYSRSVEHRFGFGRALLADVVSARMEWTPVPPLSVSAAGAYAFNRDPEADDSDYTTRSLLALIRWRLNRTLHIASNYSFGQSTEAGPVAATRNHGVSIGISYDPSW